jgi:CRISPR-associated endoribonuclease Cas6
VYYYKPYEEQFSTLIRANAIKKYKAFLSMKNERYSEKSIDNMKLSIVPANFSIRKNKKIMYFKDTVICAYTGIFQLSGDPELIWITYESGLGGKNSQGFGMWSVYDPRASKADEVLEALSVKPSDKVRN